MPSLARVFVTSGLAFAVPVLSASAATLCVKPSGANGCFARISDAVAAAGTDDLIQVAAGTYREAVTLTKPLSIATSGAVLDATGLPRGFFVDGLDAKGLTRVHISGFTVENANFEGILVANSSSVTLSSNQVINNNRSLIPSATSATCPGLPAYETSEANDCGEGIHLLGADHAIVTENTVTGNSGGILISDDTAASHDNLITFNTVRDNPYACGITMASHPAASLTGSATSLGVYHNTVYGNSASNDGAKAGGGAGVGIFASVAGAKSYGNVVVNNLLTNNGLPGIAMHAHAPNQVLSDNVLVGNIVLNNGADTADAATPGPAGINIYSLGPAPGNIVSGNVVASESYDVTTKVPSLVQVEFNDLFGPGSGVDNLGAGTVDATNNWWTCPNGPGSGGFCASANGAGVLAAPFLSLPILPQPVF